MDNKIQKLTELALRRKVRWQYRGQCSLEDLWDLNLQFLDGIYKKLSSEARLLNEDSLLDDNPEKETLTLKIEIVKHIFNVKQGEKKESEQAMLKAAKKQELLGILAQKQSEELLRMPIEEIQAMIASL